MLALQAGYVYRPSICNAVCIVTMVLHEIKNISDIDMLFSILCKSFNNYSSYF